MRIKADRGQAKALKDLRQAGELLDVSERGFFLQALFN